MQAILGGVLPTILVMSEATEISSTAELHGCVDMEQCVANQRW